MFGYFRQRRRKRLRTLPFPSDWREYLHRNVGWYKLLTTAERTKLEADLRIFIAEKNWEGCAGLAMSDEIQVTIAGQVSLLNLAWDDYHFDGVVSVLVYPAAYRAKGREEFGHSLPSERVGEAFGNETVVLSWRDSRADARGTRDGRNVVLHEFAHVLDMDNGDADGIPYISSAAGRQQWTQVIHREMEQLHRRALARTPTLLDPYGADSPAEFFAVATEAFFELAPEFRTEHPQLYQLFRDYFKQDPAERFTTIS
jgi:Mlc titration factor MtfA (ptsG expression regulator)